MKRASIKINTVSSVKKEKLSSHAKIKKISLSGEIKTKKVPEKVAKKLLVVMEKAKKIMIPAEGTHAIKHTISIPIISGYGAAVEATKKISKQIKIRTQKP